MGERAGEKSGIVRPLGASPNPCRDGRLMILNSYGVLLALVDVIRLALGLIALWLGVTACLAATRRSASSIDRSTAEDRLYLTFLLTSLLIGLNFVSWPLLYLMLQSYVSEWAGVMCIYVVTRCGSGSGGARR